MKDAIIVTKPISVFVTPKLGIIIYSKGDAITNNEWLSECAAPNRASWLFFFDCPNLIQPFCLVENCSFSIKGLTLAKLNFKKEKREK